MSAPSDENDKKMKEIGEFNRRRSAALLKAEESLQRERMAAIELARVRSTVELSKETRKSRTREVLAGMVVALAGIPTSLAYSSIVGVNPLSGIWTSVILGGTVGLFGGGPGMVILLKQDMV